MSLVEYGVSGFLLVISICFEFTAGKAKHVLINRTRRLKYVFVNIKTIVIISILNISLHLKKKSPEIIATECVFRQQQLLNFSACLN